MSEVFVSTDARRACPRSVIRSTLGACVPEVQVRIPSVGMGTIFPHTVSSAFRLSLTRFVGLSGGPCRCLTLPSRR